MRISLGFRRGARVRAGDEPVAKQYGLPAEDQVAWARASDPTSPLHPVNDPAGYYAEGNVLAVGRVPRDVA